VIGEQCADLDELGFAIPQLEIEDAVDVAKAAEEYGFESVWAGEAPTGKDTFVMMSAYAIATKGVRLGTSIVNVYTRHPSPSPPRH
jgi:alkanesulfonate monooxygenase SsuD/methylene tetrahydromethanopterin reductase-like flavin-dependent oxidoreductase (luciferase family)